MLHRLHRYLRLRPPGSGKSSWSRWRTCQLHEDLFPGKCETNSLWARHLCSINVTSNPYASRKPLLISITTENTLEYPSLLVRQTALSARDSSAFELARVEDGLRESRLSLEVDEEVRRVAEGVFGVGDVR